MHSHHMLTLLGDELAQLTLHQQVFSDSNMDIQGDLPAATIVGAVLCDFFLDGMS